MNPQGHKEISHTLPTPPHNHFSEDMEYAQEQLTKARGVLNATTPQFEELKKAYEELPALRITEIKEALGIPESVEIWNYTLNTNPTITSPETAEEALRAKNISFSSWSKDTLSQTPFSHEGRTYNLVQLTVEQLGFPSGATRVEIYNKALSLGLHLCPAEVGPHLRLVYLGKDWKSIAMEPILDSDGRYLRAFCLDAYVDELVLESRNVDPDARLDTTHPWVFMVLDA